MRTMRPLQRLCSRVQVRDTASRSSATPFRRIHQDLRIRRIAPLTTVACSHRHAFSTTPMRRDVPTTPSAAPAAAAEGAQAKEEVPSYQMTFTCKACSTRSSHRISKQGYHKGTVLIACPGCKNRHLISDHLKIFSDKSITLEDILKDKGEKLKLGHVSDDGDLEFWDDGSQTPRSPMPEKKAPADNAQNGEAATPGASFKKGP